MYVTLRLLIQHVGHSEHKGYTLSNSAWNYVLKRRKIKSQVEPQLPPKAHQGEQQEIRHLRQKLRWAKGSRFTLLHQINDANGNPIRSNAMMEAFVTQMEQKQSPPSTGDFPPPPKTKPPKFSTTMEA